MRWIVRVDRPDLRILGQIPLGATVSGHLVGCRIIDFVEAFVRGHDATLHFGISRRIGGIEAMLRERAGAEGPRRAAAGASKAARRAGKRDGAGQPLLGPMDGSQCASRASGSALADSA